MLIGYQLSVVASRDVTEDFHCRTCNADATLEDGVTPTNDPGTMKSNFIAVAVLLWINQWFCENCARVLNFAYRLEFLPGGRYAAFSNQVLKFLKHLDDDAEARRQ